jgi:hypothetical protein
VGTAAPGCPAGEARLVFADTSLEETMSTRSQIRSGKSEGKTIHIYWELADREVDDGKKMRAPIYIAVEGRNADEEVSIRLPKEIAMRLLMGLVPNWADEVARVL